MLSNSIIFSRSKVAVEEAFKLAAERNGSLKLLQAAVMSEEYPPTYIIISDEMIAQEICTITTHRKGDHLILRMWSPFYESCKDDGITKNQPWYDFEYRTEGDFNSNAEEIARLIWHYFKLLWTWHMSYSEDFDGFDLDKD